MDSAGAVSCLRLVDRLARPLGPQRGGTMCQTYSQRLLRPRTTAPRQTAPMDTFGPLQHRTDRISRLLSLSPVDGSPYPATALSECHRGLSRYLGNTDGRTPGMRRLNHHVLSQKPPPTQPVRHPPPLHRSQSPLRPRGVPQLAGRGSTEVIAPEILYGFQSFYEPKFNGCHVTTLRH